MKLRIFPNLAGPLIVAFLVGTVVVSGAKVSRFPGRRDDVRTLGDANNGRVLRILGRGLSPVGTDFERAALATRMSPRMLDEVERMGVAAGDSMDNAMRAVAMRESSRRNQIRQREPFGPHMSTSQEARRIGRIGTMFTETTSQIRARLGLTKEEAVKLKGIPTLHPHLECPFDVALQCDIEAKYRTIDGSCNNLNNPIWGRSHTPFERFVAPQYDDGLSSARQTSVFGTPLPKAREISTRVHQASNPSNLDSGITHMTMEFGQLVSHDINRNTLSSGLDGASLVCCNADGSIDNDPNKERLGCLPLEIPSNDPYFGRFNRTCMNFVRAINTPDINCNLGNREQLNQNTHYLDASAVYGSDGAAMNDLREHVDGLMRTTNSAKRDLLPQNPAATGTPACVTTGSQHCFKAGDVRANQQPALMSLHTLFVREHNRLARELKTLNPSWDDETLFQEARKIVGAEIQHVTYNEYLPTILGNDFSTVLGFPASPRGFYYREYDDTVMAAVRNGFVAAGYRFGHSTVRDHMAVDRLFKDNYLKPEILYDSSKGPDYVILNLFLGNQQKMDRYMSNQLTNHLLEKVPGGGLDLASMNIQRGRDHGLANYNIWRLFCRLSPAAHFGTGEGGLVDHEPAVASLLESVYSHVDDLDLWTAIVTERPVDGGVVGPTGACIIGRQFWVLKNGDRFYYENNNPHAKFKIHQLDEIRNTTLARIICDNTDNIFIQRDVFKPGSFDSSSNGFVLCNTFSRLNLTTWTSPQCIDGGWSGWLPWTGCFSGLRFRFRRCNNPEPSNCGQPCVGQSYWVDRSCGNDRITYPRRGRARGRGQTEDMMTIMRRIAPEGVDI